jgi:hypothetical protein
MRQAIMYKSREHNQNIICVQASTFNISRDFEIIELNMVKIILKY